MLTKQWDHIKSQQRFKSEAHGVYIEKIKIAPSSNDDKRLQTFDIFTSYCYGVSVLEKYAKQSC